MNAAIHCNIPVCKEAIGNLKMDVRSYCEKVNLRQRMMADSPSRHPIYYHQANLDDQIL